MTCGCGGDSAASVQLIRGCLSSSSRFIAGLGIGPLALAPLSEFYGRAPIYIIGYFLYGCFSFLVAFGNFGGVLAGRAIQGLAGSAFLSVAGGSVSDLWIGQQVGPPMALYSAFPFIGPVLGELHVPQIHRGGSADTHALDRSHHVILHQSSPTLALDLVHPDDLDFCRACSPDRESPVSS